MVRRRFAGHFVRRGQRQRVGVVQNPAVSCPAVGRAGSADAAAALASVCGCQNLFTVRARRGVSAAPPVGGGARCLPAQPLRRRFAVVGAVSKPFAAAGAVSTGGLPAVFVLGALFQPDAVSAAVVNFPRRGNRHVRHFAARL